MIGDVKTYRSVESRRQVHSRLSRFPGGIVVGDSLASVNPGYGQGLTLTSWEANAPAAYLRTTPAWSHFRPAEAVADGARQLSTGAVLAQPLVTGPYPRSYRGQKRVADRLTEASVSDPHVNTAFISVVNVERSPRAPTGLRLLGRAARLLINR